jgi:hypothetical protein
VSLLVALLLATGILGGLLLTPASASDDGSPGSDCSTANHVHDTGSTWTAHDFSREYDVVRTFHGLPMRFHYHEWAESVGQAGGYGAWESAGTHSVVCEVEANPEQ